MANTPLIGHGQIRSFRMPADFWLRRADRCRTQNQPMRAVTILRHAMQLEPASAELRLEYATELRALNCYESSNRECLELLAEHPGCFSAYGLLAQNMLSLAKVGEAMDAYAMYAMYARLYPEELPDWDDGVYDVEDALDALPRPPRPARFRSLLLAAERALTRGDLPRAHDFLARARLKPFPARSPQRDALLALYHHQKKESKWARLYALRVLQTAPKTPALLLPMALCLRQLRDPAAARALLAAAVNARTPEDERGVCVTAWELGHAEIAAGMLERTLRRYPGRMSAAYDLCVLKLRLGDLSAAAAHIHRLREIDPEELAVEALFGRVTRLESEEAGEDAIRALGRQEPFYGMPDDRIRLQSLCVCFDALREGTSSFAQRLMTDRRLYRVFLSLFETEDHVYELLPGVCGEMLPASATILLRHVLLMGASDAGALETATRLLANLGERPPYLVRSRERMLLVDPAETPPREPCFLQRLLYRRLGEIAQACRTPDALPLALHVIANLSRADRGKMAGDRYEVWSAAFALTYARLYGSALPLVRYSRLSAPAKAKLKHALRAIRKTLHGGKSHGID